ncbi:MAG TPA: hypothetical protein V6C89_09260 [Drouetiella sp.]
MDNARSMTTEDGTQTKNQEKERVVAAISALKAQGADVNPYTVSGEAQVPRSTLYRDPELMDLIYRERNGDDSTHMSSDEFQTKIAELEEANEALNEQIWDLEKQLETMTKAKQDAYVQGFQAGIEEAAKRLAASTGAETTGPRQAIKMETPVAESVPASQIPEFEPTPVAAALGETNYVYSEAAVPVTARTGAESGGKGPAKRKLDETTGEYEPLSDSHIAGDYHFGDSLTAQEPDENYNPAESLSEAKYAEAAAAPEAEAQQNSWAGPEVGPESEAEEDEEEDGDEDEEDGEEEAGEAGEAAENAEPTRPQFSNPEETGEHDIFDDIESLVSEQREISPKSKSTGPDIDFSKSYEQPAATVEPERPAAARVEPEPARKKKNFPDIDFGLSSEPEHGGSNGGEYHQDAVAAGAKHAAPRPSEPQHAGVAAQAAEEGAVGQLARDPAGIYNIARSGPTVSSSAYNPLVELSWKDLQTVYNFSVASLKDYAKPGFGNEPGALGGTNFADSSTQQPRNPAPAIPQAQTTAPAPAEQQTPRGAARHPEPQEFPDPRRTGDRLQALSDPRNLLDSEPIVDLDALDIFDDLDDYVDLDKIEVIEDVIAKPKADEPSMGGDELRELIKGRIKQAAEMPNEPSAPRMTTPPAPSKEDGKDAKDGKGAPVGGARNKFIGGAKAGQEPPAATPSFVVKQIPPEIRKACMILGLKPEEATQKSVIEAWKKQIASPGVHPDLGGDTEAAVYLNTAKDQLVRWLDQQAPKLGKKFGQPQKTEPPRPKKDDD